MIKLSICLLSLLITLPVFAKDNFTVYHNAAYTQNSCCKMCRKGKACGNSCISRYDVCHKSSGCACDAE